jgi:hypothetical protein
MTLSEQERAALRAYWLGEPLDETIRAALEDSPADETARERQLEMRRYLLGLASADARRTRRMGLAYAPLAVAQLVDLIHGESAETSRKAAVDLLRHWDKWAKAELAADAAALAAEHRRLTSRLTDDQVERLWAILAESGGAIPVGDPSGVAPPSAMLAGADPPALARVTATDWPGVVRLAAASADGDAAEEEAEQGDDDDGDQ